MASLAQLRIEVERELTENILPYYLQYSVDREYGGFYGRIDNDNLIHRQAPKGLVQNSRLLWVFARAYRRLKTTGYRVMADRAFDYLLDHFWDEDVGGLYWLVDFRGRPLVTDKYVYGQAFGIYGFSEYYLATGDERGLEMAVALYHHLENKAVDRRYGGYFEVFQRDWGLRLPKNVDKASGPIYKTMNSHLHLLEAYTNLLQAWPGDNMVEGLRSLIQLHLDKIIDPVTGHLLLHFAADWTPLNKHNSFGHDIEASWLLVEATEMFDDATLLTVAQDAALRMAQAVYEKGLDSDGGLLDGSGQMAKEWWPQAEALVGFLNAYQLSREPHYLEAVRSVWDYLQKMLIDHSNGEWFSGRQADGALLDQEKVGLWKTPYHNSRACLELMSRLDKYDPT